VNGLDGSRRLARPVRLALASQFGGDLDGAWWPYAASVAQELPELIECLHKPLGEIVDMCINWSVTEGPLDLDTIVNGTRSVAAAKFRRPRLMVVDGRAGRVKLLVLPPMTSPMLGGLVMRCAAGMPVIGADRDSPLFDTAELVVRTAQVESSRWTAEMPVPVAPKKVARQRVKGGRAASKA
jgi:hypothetical protein